jgi:hypothetical protein
MLSLPAGRVLVVQVADEAVPPVLMATALHPAIAVDPLKNSNSTVPAGVVPSDAETVAVKVTDVPNATLVELADSEVVVPISVIVTVFADDVDVAYELLVAVNSAVMLSLPAGRVVVHVADAAVPPVLMATEVQLVIGATPLKNLTVPAGVVLSLAETVAVKVTDVAGEPLVTLAVSVVVVAMGVIVTTTAGDVDDPYSLLVGVKTAVMLSLPTGRVLVVQVADAGGLTATAVHAVTGVVPLKNSTVPAWVVLSLAETVAVKVTDVPRATLVALAVSVVVVTVSATVTVVGGDVEVAYELLVGVKTAVTLSLPTGRVLVVQVADAGGLTATAVHPVTAVVPSKNSTVPAGVVLSLAETVAVKVTDVPGVTLVALADRVVVVGVPLAS